MQQRESLPTSISSSGMEISKVPLNLTGCSTSSKVDLPIVDRPAQFEKALLTTMPENNSAVFRYQQFIMDIFDTMSYEKEDWLEAMVETSGLSPEEFSRDYVIEEYPLEIIRVDDILQDDYKFKIEQKYRVRLKTPEERQLEIETNKEKNNDDPNNA
jgi:hypothetical protein